MNRWLIWSNEHNAWWRDNKCGYTTYAIEAGVYSTEDAVEICEAANYRAGGHSGMELSAPAESMVPVTFLETLKSRIVHSIEAKL